MAEYSTAVTAGELLRSLNECGAIAPADNDRLEAFVAAEQGENELPLYLRILAGVGAFIASLCFIGFLSESGIINFNYESGLALIGVFFVGSAIILARRASKGGTLLHTFLVQSSFCLMGMGKILFIMGFANFFRPHEGWSITFATLIISIATYYIYRMSIDRFLSTLAVFVSAFLSLNYDPLAAVPPEILINFLFCAQLLVGAALFTGGKIKREHLPVAYALACSLCFEVLFFTVQSKVGVLRQAPIFRLEFVNATLTVALIILIAWTAGGFRKLKSEPLMLASLGALLLGSISAPGVILALCLAVLGYAMHQRLLILMGFLLLPIFLVLYYYNLDVNLMAKSGILVASGVLLLAGRIYMSARGIGREEQI